uniref:Transmembrane protein n=1 Tax=Panagrellus redivivus TaxID=6233 RepID=A0A7E4W135_PANRE
MKEGTKWKKEKRGDDDDVDVDRSGVGEKFCRLLVLVWFVVREPKTKRYDDCFRVVGPFVVPKWLAIPAESGGCHPWS